MQDRKFRSLRNYLLVNRDKEAKGDGESEYLRLVSWWVKSLISSADSLRENKVPGTSSLTTLSNPSIETASLLKA